MRGSTREVFLADEFLVFYLLSYEMPKKTAPLIELFRTDAYYIFQNGEHSLWWNRVTGQCEAKSGKLEIICYSMQGHAPLIEIINI
jgi:hypothetical protein